MGADVVHVLRAVLARNRSVSVRLQQCTGDVLPEPGRQVCAADGWREVRASGPDGVRQLSLEALAIPA